MSNDTDLLSCVTSSGEIQAMEVEEVLGGFVLHQEFMQIPIKVAEKPLRNCRHLDCSCAVL